MKKANQLMKRTAALLLAIVLVLGMIPGSSYADEDTAGEVVFQEVVSAAAEQEPAPREQDPALAEVQVPVSDAQEADVSAAEEETSKPEIGVSEKEEASNTEDLAEHVQKSDSAKKDLSKVQEESDDKSDKKGDAAELQELSEEATVVTVTISDKSSIVTGKDGKKVQNARVELTGKELYTIDDVLKEAHELYYKGGMAAGYQSYVGQYGLSLGKLWGDDSGCFGYYVNGNSAWSLADPVADGDQIYAFIYEDQSGWSDVFAYFDQADVQTTIEEPVTLTLFAQSYDPDTYAPVNTPLVGASISINGKTSRYVTDKNGHVQLSFAKTGTYTISASATDGSILVPPVSVITVVEDMVTVEVKISEAGNLRVYGDVTVSGKRPFTIDDVLKAVHKQYSLGSYVSNEQGWITAFLGKKGASVGYTLNNEMPMDVFAEVEEGDSLYAYTYADTDYYSDIYTWFDISSAEVCAGCSLDVIVTGQMYDNWNMSEVPMENLTITIDGKKTNITTDANGHAEIPFETPGTYRISAVSEDYDLIPPVCMVEVYDGGIFVDVKISNAGELIVNDTVVLSSQEPHTIDDVLRAIDAEYELGGYASNEQGWITTFLGIDGIGVGYALNNETVTNEELVFTEVHDQDLVYAYTYVDIDYYSDIYTWFDQEEAILLTGDTLELTATGQMYDSGYNLHNIPMEDLTITIDGKETKIYTDEEGKASITFDEPGTYFISAVSDVFDLVPPVCLVLVTDNTIGVDVILSNMGELWAYDTMYLSGQETYTMDDVLRQVEEEYMFGGYESTASGWVTKLMGDSSQAFGFYLNDRYVAEDPLIHTEVHDGDKVYAYIYADQDDWSDMYAAFDIQTAEITAGEPLELTLTADMFGMNLGPVENAVITIDGEETEFITDENGKAVVTFDEEGEYFVSACSEDYVLVPPTCYVTVGEAPEPIPPVIRKLSVQADGEEVVLSPYFDPAIDTYTIAIPEETEELTFKAVPQDKGSVITYNGAASGVISAQDLEKVEIVITDSEDDTLSNIYTVNVVRAESGTFRVFSIPADAIVNVRDPEGKSADKTEDGAFTGLFSAREYTYTVSRAGYVSVTGTVPAAGGTIRVNLTKAPASTLNDVSAEWDSFRGSSDNMGITDAKTPKSKEESKLLWTKEFGSDYTQAPSVQIIADNAIVLMAGNKIYKLNKTTGETLTTGTMAAPASYGYTSPIYAEGMILCPLSNGTIQAFNAETLESLWIYKDPMGGQALTPITYANGYIYTGFWNGEEANANYVCISLTDENPGNDSEGKEASWSHTEKGGYYWAGAAAVGNYLAVGSSDAKTGANGTSKITLFDQKTGRIVSSLNLADMGDVRSTVAYADGKLYFTTAAGYLVSASVDPEKGTLFGLKSVSSGAASTSTPVVYGGKVYYTNNRNFICADADTLETLFKVEMKGYPQCSLLLSKAYESDGYLYFYSTYNKEPGGVSLIKVKKNAASAADAELIELYDAAGHENYCISSIICDQDGTLYYKNDSCTVFAIAAGAQSSEEEKKDDEEDKKDDGEDDKKEDEKKDTTAAGSTAGGIVIGNPGTADTAIVVNGKSFSVRSDVADLMKKIERLGGTDSTKGTLTDSLENLSDAQIDMVLDVYRAFEALSADEQIFIRAYSKLGTLTEAAGKANHRSAKKGVSVNSGNVPWYVQLIVEEKPVDKAIQDKIEEALGMPCENLVVYSISFYDRLHDTNWNPEGDITIRMPAPDKKGHASMMIARVAADGSVILAEGKEDGSDLLFTSQEFGICGIIGYDEEFVKLYKTNTEEETVETEAGSASEEKEEWKQAPVAALAVLIIAGLFLFLLIGKKRKDDEE